MSPPLTSTPNGGLSCFYNPSDRTLMNTVWIVDLRKEWAKLTDEERAQALEGAVFIEGPMFSDRAPGFEPEPDEVTSRLEELCDRWDTLSKGETPTTRQIREAMTPTTNKEGLIVVATAPPPRRSLNERLEEALRGNEELKAEAWDNAADTALEQALITHIGHQTLKDHNPYRRSSE